MIFPKSFKGAPTSADLFLIARNSRNVSSAPNDTPAASYSFASPTMSATLRSDPASSAGGAYSGMVAAQYSSCGALDGAAAASPSGAGTGGTNDVARTPAEMCSNIPLASLGFLTMTSSITRER